MKLLMCLQGVGRKLSLIRKSLPVATQRSLEIQKRLGDKKGIAIALSNIGNSYSELGDDKLALQYKQQALQLAEELRDSTGILVLSGNVGVEFKKQKRYNDALVIFRKALIIASRLNDQRAIAIQNGNIGSLFLALAEEGKGVESNLLKAIALQRSGVELSKQIG